MVPFNFTFKKYVYVRGIFELELSATGILLPASPDSYTNKLSVGLIICIDANKKKVTETDKYQLKLAIDSPN